MNEITRIHIAKIAYDIEVTAKKQLEKYIKSLETYTQDGEVLADIEIRITELLAERNVVADGVIGTEDVAAIRKQLGEPYEFADEDGDIAVGAMNGENEKHRLFRSLDDAVLGGVLSGIAGYFKVNPLWTRLVFLLIAFISFGLALPLYIVLWIIVPPARTAAEKLQLAGKPVTVESIRELNALAELSKSRSIAPVLKKVLRVALGVTSILAAAITLVATICGAALIIGNNEMNTIGHGFFGDSTEGAWLAWVVFWIIAAGGVLLAALFFLIAYAFLAKKLTKTMIISGIVIIALGIAAAVASVSIIGTQQWRVSTEAQSSVQTTKLNLPKEFANVTSVVFENPKLPENAAYFASTSSIQYIVDEGAPRYELTALPKAKASIKIDGTVARISMDIPKDYRNGYVQPSLIVYGPALTQLETNGVSVNYSNVLPQPTLKMVLAKNYGEFNANGTFDSIEIEGKGSVDVSSSAIQSLTVRAQQDLSVLAGTVRELTVTQPDVCASSTYSNDTSVTVSGVTSNTMTYNGKQVPAESYRSSCASVTVGGREYDN